MLLAFEGFFVWSGNYFAILLLHKKALRILRLYCNWKMSISVSEMTMLESSFFNKQVYNRRALKRKCQHRLNWVSTNPGFSENCIHRDCSRNTCGIRWQNGLHCWSLSGQQSESWNTARFVPGRSSFSPGILPDRQWWFCPSFFWKDGSRPLWTDAHDLQAAVGILQNQNAYSDNSAFAPDVQAPADWKVSNGRNSSDAQREYRWKPGIEVLLIFNS